MKKTLKLFIILMISLLVMVACSNGDTTTEDSGKSDYDSTSETDQTENNDVNESSDQEDVENDNADSANSQTDEVPVLALGETGVIEDTLGTYEVTATGFSFETEMSEDDPYQTPYNGTFVVIDVMIKNIGETILDSEDITNTSLYREDTGGMRNSPSFSSIENFIGNEIKPGEILSGQLLFDLGKEDYYELAFGANMPEHISNEVRWALHAEDAE